MIRMMLPVVGLGLPSLPISSCFTHSSSPSWDASPKSSVAVARLPGSSASILTRPSFAANSIMAA